MINGSQKLRNATGAIETISTEELKDLSVGSLGDALAGKINGLHVSLSGGRQVVHQAYRFVKVQ